MDVLARQARLVIPVSLAIWHSRVLPQLGRPSGIAVVTSSSSLLALLLHHGPTKLGQGCLLQARRSSIRVSRFLQTRDEASRSLKRSWPLRGHCKGFTAIAFIHLSACAISLTNSMPLFDFTQHFLHYQMLPMPLPLCVTPRISHDFGCRLGPHG